MNSIRLAGIPTDHVIAEMAAFPLASEESLRLGLTRLDPAFNSRVPGGPETQRLWRAAERHLLGSFPAFSIDEAVAVRDAVWFRNPAAPSVPLHAYLRRVANWYLEARGEVAEPQLLPDERATHPSHTRTVLARERWRWLGLAMPPDLLLAALGRGAVGPTRVEVLSPSLEAHLRDHGYAEMHLHLGAAIEFPLVWISALRAIVVPSLLAWDAFKSPGAVLGEGEELGAWLVRAALVRYLLAAFLGRRRSDEHLMEYLERVSEARLLPEIGAVGCAWLRQVLEEVRVGQLNQESHSSEGYARCRSLYGIISGLAAVGRTIGRRDEALRADPIESLLPATLGTTWSAEMRLVGEALAYLEACERNGRVDASFARLFWQVVRIRCLFYRHMVQRPMTPGLQWFVRFYGRSSPARKPLAAVMQLESAAELGGHGRGLRALEIRTSPDASSAKLRGFVESVDQVAGELNPQTGTAQEGQPRSARPAGGLDLAASGAWGRSATRVVVERRQLEVGIVFHFTKDREGGAREGLPIAHARASNADPRVDPRVDPEEFRGGNPTGYRYGRFFAAKQREAVTLCWLLHHYPLCLEVVRGVDVCTDELGIPNWVLAPLFAEVRKAGEAAALAVRRQYGRAVPGIRTTVHAGEDFVHLLTGLRQVDEAVEGFQLRSGDRIGHGIALGVDVREWARRVGHVPIPSEERLWDLVWEWSWYARGGDCVDYSRPQYLERQIALLSRTVFQTNVSPFDLERLRLALYDPRALTAVGFPDREPPEQQEDQPIANCLVQYLTHPGVFQRGQAVMWVDASAEAKALASLQAELRRKVGTRGLSVEVNPTSNLLIGNLGDLKAHPLWRLRPPRPTAEMPPVAVCIGSDDPLVFGSDLRQEYQALCDAMTLAGLSDEEAREWLNRARSVGLETRFTLPERSNHDLFADWLVEFQDP